MKGKIMPALAVLTVIALFVGGTAQAATLRSAAGTLHTRNTAQPGSFEETVERMGTQTQTAFIWTGPHYAVVTYGNGYYTATVHDFMPTSNPQEGKSFYGAYGNGKWSGHYNGSSIEHLFYGDYQKAFPNTQSGLFVWSATNLMSSGTVWGFGYNLFVE